MRCRECAAEVAVAARVCSRCGAPIAGQPPVVADTVVPDTVLAAISDATGKAVPAGAAGQALPEPYVPGSGDRVPAELRLVLPGYVGIGIAGGLFATALVCAPAAVDVLFGVDITFVIPLALIGCIWGLWRALRALKAGIRFSRLLRRCSDPHTATVMASKRGGRTLILDIPWDGTGRGYQSLSEVRLALWLKAGMLVPGERVTVYCGPGGESQPPRRDPWVSVGPPEEPSQPLLISSAQRGRAFLGTMQSRSTVQPGPVTPLDEKVSGATLVDWAAWAASTTFSSTGLGFGYDKQEVDVFRSAVRDTFLGVGGPAVKSDDVRGRQFSTHRPGYDEKEVAAFFEAAGLRLAAMESTDRPTGPLVSGALLAGWAEWADSTTFSKARWRLGYFPIAVDAFREEIRDTFLGATRSPVKSDDVRGMQFSSADFPPSNGYDKKQVAAFLDAAGIRLAAMERREIPGVICMSTDRPDGPLISDAILAGWAEWADSTRFSTSRRREGYDTAEVDAFREEVRDTFLGASKPPDEWPTVQDLMPWPSPSKPPARSDDLRGKQFSTHRSGYDKEQVDSFLDKAEPRLAAMRATDKGAT
jgi:DivIVA domain-containing protein